MKYEIIICPACGVDVLGNKLFHSAICDCGEIITWSNWKRSHKPVFTLNQTGYWFDETAAGRKAYEYREEKPFYDRRILVYGDRSRHIFGEFKINGKWYKAKDCIIQYINGMRPDSRRWFVHCTGVHVGPGDPDRGAVPGVNYYCIGNGTPVSGQRER